MPLENGHAELRRPPKLLKPVLRAGRSTAHKVAVFVAVAAFSLGLAIGCSRPMPGQSPSTPLRDINAVLADHDKELLAIPGVVGVYVGLLSDEKTPCLKIMLSRSDADLKRRIPPRLEGYQVVTEVTGEIRPLK